MIYYPHSWVIDSSRVFPGPLPYYMVEKKWHRFAFDASALPRARLSRASAYFVDGLSIFILFFFYSLSSYLTDFPIIIFVLRSHSWSTGHVPSQWWDGSFWASSDGLNTKCRGIFHTSHDRSLKWRLKSITRKPRHCSVDAPLCCISDLDEPMHGDPTSRVLNHQLPGQNCPIVLH